MLAQHYIELAKAPISDIDFYGDDVRYSAEFETLESELAKANSLHQTQGPDWVLVREGSESLLQSQSKDLRATVWLTWSLYKLESLAGLQAGLATLTYLCSHHWESLHPRKPRTRLAAFTWLLTRLDQAVEELASFPAEATVLEALATELKSLDSCLASHFADDAPVLLPLSRRFTELARGAAPVSQTPPAAAAQTNAQVIPIKASMAESVSAVTNAKEAHKCLRSIQDQSRHLCDWWLEQSPTDPRAVKLARTLLWIPIENLPEHDAEQKTTLRGLPADRVAQFQERLNQGQFNELLPDLEASLARAPFWLEGQHLAWQCLEALNAAPAMYELELQLAMLLKRLPGLEQLCFFDGTAFAGDEARSWISSRVMPHIQSGQSTAAQQSTDSEAAWEIALRDAITRMRKDDLKSAIQDMKLGMQQARGERERFHWQLAQARLCCQAKKYELAKHQLESLYQVLQHSELERWEPDLALSVLQLLMYCCERLPSSPALRERKSEIYQRLCHLDLEAALDQASGP
ncbi:MAG: type VI secretion system protein TssA [Pseudomonas sp.]